MRTATTLHRHTDHLTEPGADGWRDEHRAVLLDALAGTGPTPDLDPADVRYVGWLAGWDCETVAGVARLLTLAREHVAPR